MGRSRLADEPYLYDALMNLAASGAGLHDYHADCVVRAGGNTYVYDVRGRMVSRTVARAGFRPQTTSYAWDGFDRLVELRTPGEAVWRYTYDAFGRRVGKRCVTPGQAAAVAYVWEGPRLSEARHSGPGGEVAERWHYGAGFEPLAKEVFSAEGRCLWQAEHELWAAPRRNACQRGVRAHSPPPSTRPPARRRRSAGYASSINGRTTRAVCTTT